MNLFPYKIHSNSPSISIPSRVYSKGEIRAIPIVDSGGKVISKGTQTERLGIIGNNVTYALAIQTLSATEQAQVRKQGHAGWWKQFFWKPLTLQTEQGEVTILVNINSAIKRLKHLGLTEAEIREGLNNGSLIDIAHEKYSKGGKIKEVYSDLFLSVIDDKTANMVDYCKKVLGCSIQTAYRWIEQIKANGINIEAIEQLKANGIDIEKIKKIADFIKSKKQEWEEEAKKTNQPIYIKARDFPGQIPRNLQYNPDGTIYILFNRVTSQKDKCLGEGTFKTAKRALNLGNGEMYARLTMMTSNLNTKRSILEELRMTERANHQKGIIGVNRSTVVHYSSKNNGDKIGYMQKLFDGDVEKAIDGSTLKEKEKFLIAKRLLEGISWLHAQNILHRDIKPANLFLQKDSRTKEVTDCVVADLGFACEKSNETEREKLLGSPLYMAPEYFSLFYKQQKGSSVLDEEAKQVNDTPADNWSIGISLYEIFKNDIPEWTCSNPFPFLSATTLDNFNSALQKFSIASVPVPADPHSIGHVILGLLNLDPKKRMTAATALTKVNAIIQHKGLTIS